MGKSEHNFFQSLYDIAAAITSPHTQDVGLHSIVEKVTEAMDAIGYLLMLLAPNRTLLLHTTVDGRYVNKERVSADKSTSVALKRKSTTIIPPQIRESSTVWKPDVKELHPSSLLRYCSEMRSSV